MTAVLSPLDDLVVVEAQALGELGDWMDIVDRDGSRYLRDQVHWLFNGLPSSRGPSRPPELDTATASRIREFVLDAAAFRGARPRPGSLKAGAR